MRAKCILSKAFNELSVFWRGICFIPFLIIWFDEVKFDVFFVLLLRSEYDCFAGKTMISHAFSMLKMSLSFLLIYCFGLQSEGMFPGSFGL